MQTKKSNLKYPSRYEIEQSLGYCPRTFLDKFAQSRGVFITKASKEDLAKHLSGLFFEHKDLEEVREAAFRENSFKSLSGFIIKSPEDDFEPFDFLENLRNAEGLQEGIDLGAITKEELEDGSVVAKGRMEYIDYKPGRIEFLNEETRSVEYTIKTLDDNSFQVFVESNKTKDAKKFETFLIKEVRKEVGRDAKLYTLDITKLSSPNTILFFDALARQAMNSDWLFLDVKKIMFRKSKDEEIEEVEEETLSGISQAILEGKGLRNNSFVKESEKKGFNFTAMTFEYENKKHALIVDVKVEFKFKPIVFEIGLDCYKKVSAPIEGKEKTNLPDKDEIDIKSNIWQQAREIYKELAVDDSFG